MWRMGRRRSWRARRRFKEECVRVSESSCGLRLNFGPRPLFVPCDVGWIAIWTLPAAPVRACLLAKARASKEQTPHHPQQLQPQGR